MIKLHTRFTLFLISIAILYKSLLNNEHIHTILYLLKMEEWKKIGHRVLTRLTLANDEQT